MVNKKPIGAISTMCTGCGEWLNIKIHYDKPGYYVGFFCPFCGPYSRESDFYKARVKAKMALENIERNYIEGERYLIELEMKYKTG